MSINFVLIGMRIKDLRNRKRMSQAALAEYIDMSATFISHIEAAKKQASLESLVRIANALGVTVDHLLTGNQAHDSEEYREEMASLFDGCTSYEKQVIFDVAFATKRSLRENIRLANFCCSAAKHE